MGDVVPGVEEALALDPRSGVRRIKSRLIIRVGSTDRPDHEVARLLGETRGTYCHLLGGWLLGYKSVVVSRMSPNSAFCRVRAFWFVFQPRVGGSLTVTFIRKEGLTAICNLKVGCLSHIVEVEGVAEKELQEMHPLQSLVVRLKGVSDIGRQEAPHLLAELTEVREPVGGYVRLAEQDEMGSSEEEESGMESGVDTYSRSSSRRVEEREEVRESPAKVEEGETLEENEAGNSRKRKRSENTLDPKRMKVQGISKMCSNENNAAIGAGESEVENNNVLSGKIHLLPLQPQALNSPKSAEKGAAVSKTPGNKGKEPIPSCIKKKVKKFNGINTTYYYHACDDYNYEDMRQVRAWLAEHPGHISASSVTPSKGLQFLPNCMERVKVEKKFIIRHLCDSLVFSSVPKARTWLAENPEHKPCPTLWFKGNTDTGEDEEADEGEDKEVSDADQDEVGGCGEVAGSIKGESIVEGAAKDKIAKLSQAKESGDEKDCKTGVEPEQEGFDADSEEADTDAEANQKKKKPKAARGKVVKSRGSASGDETDSSRTKACSLTQKNAPPCLKRKEKKEDGKRMTGFLHLCDSHWFSSWAEARTWLEQNEDHISFSTSMGMSGKKDKTSAGTKASKPEKVSAALTKKLKENEKNKKQSGVGPLATLQAAMEEEVGRSQIEVGGTKSPDMFDSEEENGDESEEGGKKKATGKEKTNQSKKPKKNEASESCKEGSKEIGESERSESESDDSGEDMGNSKSRMIGRQLEKELENSSVAGGTGSKEKAGGNGGKKASDNINTKGGKVAEVNNVKVGNASTEEAPGGKGGVEGKSSKDAEVKAGEKTGNSNKKREEESSSSDSGSETEGLSGTEEANNSAAGKKAVNDDDEKRKTEQSSSSESESESESEEEESSQVTNPKSSSQGSKAFINNQGPIAASQSKGEGKAAEKKDEESSSSGSESDSETEARPPVKTTEPTSTPAAPKKPPQGFSAPRLESFKKSGISSPGSTATTSGLKGSCPNTSVYESPKTQTKAQDSSSESSGSSDEESDVEEMKKKKVERIKKVKKGERAQSSSSESESGSDSSDNETALRKEKRPEGPKTYSKASKKTDTLGKKKPEEKLRADGSGGAVEKDKDGKEMEKKEKGGMSDVKDLPEKAASPTKNLKTKENKFPVPAVPRAVEQGKTVALNSSNAKASTQSVSKAGLKEKASSPVKSQNASPAKSSDVKTSSPKSSSLETCPVKSSDVLSQDGSSAKTSANLGNKKKADAKQGKEKWEPPEKIPKVVEKKKDSSSSVKTNGSDLQKDDNQQINGKSQSDQNLAKEPKKKKKDSSSPSKTKEGEAEKEVEKKTGLLSEKKSPQLSSTLVPRNNPVEKLKIHDTECSPILRKVKDAFGSYFEKTMIDGEEDTAKKQEKTEGGKQEGTEEGVKKKKKSKKPKKPEAGFL